VDLLRLNIGLFIVIALLFTACSDDVNDKNSPPKKPAAESLVKANRYLVKQEKEAIENYISRHGWKMHETGSGLRYSIVEKGNGPQAQKGNVAVLEYTSRLITGDVVYSSAKDGMKTFVIGHGGIESGLEEAVLLMHQGDQARLIIPSHLAFGLLGDDNRIPPRATLIYEIKLIELK
jgi:FKBP-type peptidyl-prolyl cis-trans isomerase